MAGDVVADDNARRQFSTDGSVLSLTPSLVVHPRVVDDVRKVARFTWRLAERGQVLPLTARGNGTDPTGAAIGRGTILSFPAHMAQIMEFDLKYRMVRVQPGITLEALSQAVATQGMRLPVDGGNSRVATVGGAIANNLPGRQFAKYGSMRDWADKLEVVLANGEIIQTGKLSRRELSEKKGLQTLEGEIYRSIDSLIEDNPDIVSALADSPSLDASCYALDLVRGDEMMLNQLLLFDRRLRRTDGHPAVKLPRVGRKDRRTVTPGHAQTQVRLARSGGSYDHQQPFNTHRRSCRRLRNR